jgi:lipoprotein-releasing system permease protein
MFELSVASKYLLPRRRQLSVSIISLVSILVIALVVWLIVVFFSVTEGLEKSWINKLTALTAPVRIIPTEAYYHSYYYQIDSVSAASGYAHKSIGEKLLASQTDPYDPTFDEELPSHWPEQELQANGEVKDPVKLAFQSIDEIKGIPGLTAQDYELTFGNIRLRLLRGSTTGSSRGGPQAGLQSFLNYPAYISSFEPANQSLQQTLLPVTIADISNLFSLLSLSGANTLEEIPKEDYFFQKELFQKRLNEFLSHVSISALKTPDEGWMIPISLLPPEASWTAFALTKGDRILRVIVPQDAKAMVDIPKELIGRGYKIAKGTLVINNTIRSFDTKTLKQTTPLFLQGGVTFPAHAVTALLPQAHHVSDVKFAAQIPIQGSSLKGDISYSTLQIASATFPSSFQLLPASTPLWTYSITNQGREKMYKLPRDSDIGESVLVPRSFKDAGVLIGDRGYLSYQSPTATSIQEQRIPVYVSGFYDPGIIPLGGKSIIASKETTSLIRGTQDQSEHAITNGINVRLNNLKQAAELKAKLLTTFEKHGISPYWHIETYREYDFTKDLLQQLQSEKNLFTLLATVIIIVACSNIISMLIILVNDKKTEIGILRSMGARSKSIAAIFGLCGCVMGFAGSVIGIIAAMLTLHNLQSLIDFISRIQGYDMFNRSLFGEVMPHELSLDTLIFVMIATVAISLLAGIVPAIKASLMSPSAILRSE